jgi:hypothetical protein
MRRALHSEEVVGETRTESGPCEVFATVDAEYDEANSRLEASFDAFLCPKDIVERLKPVSASWLPRPEKIRERVGEEEAVEAARSMFHRWAAKVRKAVETGANPN